MLAILFFYFLFSIFYIIVYCYIFSDIKNNINLLENI